MNRFKVVAGKLFVVYETMNSRHPWKLNSAMAFVIASFGDLLCQKVIHNWNKMTIKEASNERDFLVTPFLPDFVWDGKRTLDMGVIRSMLIAPFIMIWFKFLRTITPGGPILNLFCRVLIDQSVGAPVVITLAFVGNRLLQWPSLPISWEIFDSLIERGPHTWLKGLQYNPIMNSLIFAFAAPRHQPLCSHVSAIYWTAVLSYYSNKGLR